MHRIKADPNLFSTRTGFSGDRDIPFFPRLVEQKNGILYLYEAGKPVRIARWDAKQGIWIELKPEALPIGYRTDHT